MHHLQFRPTLFVLALAGTACRDAATDAIAPRVPRPSFTTDFASPPAPSNVSAAVVAGTGTASLSSTQASIQVSWMDNSTYLDEYVTCGRFTTLDNTPVTTLCAWASNYDLPAGSTGQRSANLVAPAGGPYLVRLSVARWIRQDDGWMRTVYSAESDPVVVDALVTATSPTKKKGRG